ncbi:WD40 repeat protein [Rhizina undulata]
MYWPLGAPRIYAAKIPAASSPHIYDSDDSSAELVRNSLSLSSVDNDTDEFEEVNEEPEEEEDESRKVGEKEVADQESIEAPEKKEKGRAKDSAANGEDGRNRDKRNIVALKVARNGLVFATITTSELTIWQTKPTAVVAHVRRSANSLTSYGPNIDLLIRPDSQIFVVQTSLGYLITYSLATDPNARVYKPSFANTHTHARQNSVAGSTAGGRAPLGPGGLILGVGEAGGVREYSVRFRMVIKVDAGISKALALDEELVVATVKPAAVQCIRWTPDSTGNQTTTELLSRMFWMQKKAVVEEMVHDRPMNLSTWTTDDGRAYAVQKMGVAERNSTHRMFKGYCFHIPSNTGEKAVKVAINARFSLIGVACANGSILVYNARDYNGNIPLSHVVPPPATRFTMGATTFINWSTDGYCLFAGYEHGWATWSVYGKPGGNSFAANTALVERNAGDGFLAGVRDGSWIAGGGEILLVGSRGSEKLWNLEFARSAVTGCFSSANIGRAVIQTSEKILIYRGYDQSDITAISQDTSVLWHHVQMPTAYLVDNWPIRYIVISPDGRYVAVAGKRGLAHYSVNSGRWKTFINSSMEQDFAVRGGMCWYQHLLIAAVESDDLYEIRLYSRELQLDNTLLLHIETMPSPVVLIALTGDDSLLVYTYDNVLYHFVVQGTKDTVKLVQVGQITFHGIVRAPARVRAISWIVPEEQLRAGDPSRDVAVATVVFLVDGKLVLLQPSTTDGGELKYDMRVLQQNVEYYALMRDQPLQHGFLMRLDNPQTPVDMFSPGGRRTGDGLADSLWLFDGTDMRVWGDVQDILNAPLGESGKEVPQPIRVSVDFYPMSILLGKGIILGVESELVQRRDINFSYFKISTRTHLFVHHLLRHLLAVHRPGDAIDLARNYEKLTYFSHALEVLLHDVLDDEADHPPHPEEAVLPEVVRFLSHFPHYLDVIVRCTRKTEVASWRHLFNVVGSPQALFEESLARGLLKTAGGYLLILHTLEQLSSSSQDMVRLLARAVAEGDWDLCKELARFLTALDNSGKTLKEALELVELRSPVEELDRSFMFESARLQPPPQGGRVANEGEGRESDYGFPRT